LALADWIGSGWVYQAPWHVVHADGICALISHFSARKLLRTACAVTALSLLLAQGAFAADDKGQFGVRGAGLISCELYVQERKAQADVYLITAAWVDGYITGANQHMSDTYDIMSFETTELLTAVLNEHCKKHPADPVFGVIRNLFEQLQQDRIQDYSEKTDVVIGERRVLLYVEVLKRVQDKLASAGFYEGTIDGNYGESTIDAMKAYQRSVELNPTGFPDQTTLWRLLRD